MKHVLFFLLICSLCFTPACDTVEINSAAIPLGIGFDYQQDEFVAAVQLAKNSELGDSGSGNEPKFQVLSGRGTTPSDAARRIMLQLPRLPIWSQASVLVLGEGLAKTDLSLIADFLARNRNVRKNLSIVVAIGANPAQVFQTRAPLEPYSARAITGILDAQKRQLGYYDSVEITDFLQKLTTSGIEPVLPQIRLVEEDGKKLITLDGLAVFNKRTMVGSLNETQSRGYRWLKPGMLQGGLTVITSPLNSDRHITLELLRASSKTRAEVQGNQVIMHIEIKGEGNFYESDESSEVLTLEGLAQIEKSGEEEIKNEIRDCIQQAQSLNSDIFGWGAQIASQDPQAWNALDPQWDQVFPSVQSDIQVKFDIRRTYLTYKTVTISD